MFVVSDPLPSPCSLADSGLALQTAQSALFVSVRVQIARRLLGLGGLRSERLKHVWRVSDCTLGV
eukprot:7176938-Alexandrium_andersonii.AAC.1